MQRHAKVHSHSRTLSFQTFSITNTHTHTHSHTHSHSHTHTLTASYLLQLSILFLKASLPQSLSDSLNFILNLILFLTLFLVLSSRQTSLRIFSRFFLSASYFLKSLYHKIGPLYITLWHYTRLFSANFSLMHSC